MVTVNRRDFEWARGMTVQSLLDRLKREGEFVPIINSGTVVSINSTMVHRHEFDSRTIEDDDEVLLVCPVSGG